MMSKAPEDNPGSSSPPATAKSRIENLLPPEVADAMRRAAAAATAVTPELVRELHDRHKIDTRFGISRRRLGNYLRRLKHTERQTSPDDGRHESPAHDWSTRIRRHRRRQASVASILDTVFGKLGECNPNLWGYRAYLMLLGLVYERLATNEDEIPTSELVSLAKIIAENRRVEIRLRKMDEAPDSDGRADPPHGTLPERIGDIVRQVYGANFHAPTEVSPEGHGADEVERADKPDSVPR